MYMYMYYDQAVRALTGKPPSRQKSSQTIPYVFLQNSCLHLHRRRFTCASAGTQS